MRTVSHFLRLHTLAVSLLLLSAGMLAAQPPFGRGGPSGGDRGGRGGGSPFGGGDRGGDRGRSGFDPGAMLQRFDRNGNGTIDMDERDGFAGMMLQRFASANPRIDISKPVPLSTLTEEFQRMRGGGSSPSSGRSSSTTPASDEPALLVPDFSLDYVPELPPGFGAVSEKFSVKVEERDLKEAEERMRRYDRSPTDGKLSRDELRSGRWSDDPLQYDRNKDGFLTAAELAVRYANRRVEEEARRETESEQRGGWSRGGGDRGGWGGGSDGWRRSEGGEEAQEQKSRFGEAKSFRVTESDREENLPGFLSRVDKNGDGMVMMSEFSSDWTEATLEEFLKWDLNNDGIIVYREWFAANERGVRTGSSGSSSSGSSGRPSPVPARKGGSASTVEFDWAKKQIAKYDKDGDGALVASEWEKMLVKPKGADTDGDGVLTVQEYAEFRAKK